MVSLVRVDLGLLLGFKERFSDIMVYLLKNANDTHILAKLTLENLLIIKIILHIFYLAKLHIIFSEISLIGSMFPLTFMDLVEGFMYCK